MCVVGTLIVALPFLVDSFLAPSILAMFLKNSFQRVSKQLITFLTVIFFTS
jgi:hypothetical protein